jgi:hypothetical protein
MGSTGQSRSTDVTGSERDQSAVLGHFGEHASNEELTLGIGAGGGNRTRTSLAGPTISKSNFAAELLRQLQPFGAP